MDISRAAWVGTWGAPSRQGMPNSHGAHLPLPPLRDLTPGGAGESQEGCQGGVADCPTAPDSPAKPLNVLGAVDDWALLPPLIARPGGSVGTTLSPTPSTSANAPIHPTAA